MAMEKKSQGDKFKKLAEETNCDPSDEHFNESLRQNVTQGGIKQPSRPDKNEGRTSSKRRHDDPAQSRRFMKAAKEAEADDADAAAADEVMGRMAAKPPREHKA